MPKILVIGATGYIGQALSLSLLRSGNYAVYGLARSEAKAASLSANEITPIVAPDFPSAPDAVLKVIQDQRIDVVAVAGGDEEAANILDVVKQAGQQRLKAYEQAGVHSAPKLGFLYTSGTWVHGSSNAPITDLDPVAVSVSPTPPTELVAWRAEFEKQILAPETRQVLDVIIVRPALLYGRSHAIWTSFFKPVVEAAKSNSSSVQVPLEADSRPALIHVDDVASGLHAAIEHIPLISGTSVYPVFDLAAQSEGMQDVFNALAKAVGYKGKVELVGSGDNLFALAMSASANNRSDRAKSILGWTPKRAGFVDGMDVYAAAFAAHL